MQLLQLNLPTFSSKFQILSEWFQQQNYISSSLSFLILPDLRFEQSFTGFSKLTNHTAHLHSEPSLYTNTVCIQVFYVWSNSFLSSLCQFDNLSDTNYLKQVNIFYQVKLVSQKFSRRHFLVVLELSDTDTFLKPRQDFYRSSQTN